MRVAGRGGVRGGGGVGGGGEGGWEMAGGEGGKALCVREVSGRIGDRFSVDCLETEGRGRFKQGFLILVGETRKRQRSQ